MNRFGISALPVAVCFLLAPAVYGQSKRPISVRSGDASPTVFRPVEPDFPATGSTVAAGPQAVVPRLMKFSGALHDAASKPLSGSVDVTFALYRTEAGGSPLWFETQSVQADELGRYTALLGAMHTDGLPIDLFTSGEVRWLGVQVGLEAEQPRVLLVSVPYALKAGDAETLGGKPASAYMLSAAQSGTVTGTTTTSTAGGLQTGTGGTTQKSRTSNTSPLTTVCASISSNIGGVTYSVPRFTSMCNIENSIITQTGSNVGIGTAAPSYKLDVVGGSARVTNPSGTTQIQVSGSASSGRLGQDAGGFFFASDTNGSALRFLTNNGALNEWVRITSAGNVGIGTTAPGGVLDVEGVKPAAVGSGSGTNATSILVIGGAAGGDSSTGSGGNGAAVTIQAGNGGDSGSSFAGTGAGVTISAGNGGNGFGGGTGGSISFQPGAAGTGAVAGTGGNLYLAPNGGFVGIGTTSPDSNLSVDGGADKTGGGSWATFSDARLKTVEGDFHPGLVEIMKLNPIIYRYNEQNAMGIKDHDAHVGFVAQEVEKVIPEAVTKNAMGFRLVNNDPILWTMLNAVKEQQAIIQKQQTESDALRSEIQKQRALTNVQQLRLESQQEQITQLLSQVRMIRATLKVSEQTRTAERLAKVVAPSRTTSGKLSISPATGGGR